MAYGLRLDQVVRDNSGNLVSSFSAPQRMPVVDFRFNRQGLSGIYVHGINLTAPIALKAAEGGESPSWLVIGGTVAAATGLAILASNDGGNSGGGSAAQCAAAFTLSATACVDVYGNIQIGIR